MLYLMLGKCIFREITQYSFINFGLPSPYGYRGSRMSSASPLNIYLQTNKTYYLIRNLIVLASDTLHT